MAVAAELLLQVCRCVCGMGDGLQEKEREEESKWLLPARLQLCWIQWRRGDRDGVLLLL